MTRDLVAVERNFLGCLLRSPHDFWDVNDMVAPDMFSVPVHQKIYDAIRSIAQGGRQVTNATLQAHLPAEDDEGTPYIAQIAVLKENASEAGAAQDYASAISERSAANRIAELGEWMAKSIKGGKKSPEEVAAEAALILQEVMTVASPVRPKLLGDVASDVARYVSSGSTEVRHGLNTGIAALDEILGLMLPGDLGAIIASQGDGKSALAAQIGMHAAVAGFPVLYIQLEMSDEQMAVRELAARSGIAVNQIHEGAFDAFEWEKVSEAERGLRKVPFYVLDADEMSVAQMESQAFAMKRRIGLGLLITDQLDKVKARLKYRDRFERFMEITGDKKRAAKRLKVPWITLAQRTRGSQRRDDPEPHILDADAPSLERDCDWVIGLWQIANWMRQNKPDMRKVEDFENWKTKIRQAEGRADLIALKRRRGKAFQQRELRFEGATMRFTEAR